jgi:hypothetical protein
MQILLINVLRVFLALAAGGIIGYAFGLIQNLARLRHEKRQLEGKFNNGWSIIPGSGARIACLLVALLLIQAICPLMFTDGVQWTVSGGVVLGYTWTLIRQLRQRLKANTLSP